MCLQFLCFFLCSLLQNLIFHPLTLLDLGWLSISPYITTRYSIHQIRLFLWQNRSVSVFHWFSLMQFFHIHILYFIHYTFLIIHATTLIVILSMDTKGWFGGSIPIHGYHNPSLCYHCRHLKRLFLSWIVLGRILTRTARSSCSFSGTILPSGIVTRLGVGFFWGFVYKIYRNIFRLKHMLACLLVSLIVTFAG